MTTVITDQYYPIGPFGTFFWAGYWAPRPKILLTDITGEANLQAEPIDYHTIKLTWNQVRIQFSRYVLIRSQYGHPITPTDGIVILLGTANTAISYSSASATPQPSDTYVAGFDTTSYIDGGLNPGFYYYTLFVELLP